MEIINKTKLMACFGPYSNLSKNCRNIHFKMWIYVTCTKIVPYINKIVFGLSFTDSRPLKLRKSINFSKKTMISMDCYQLLSFFYISNKFSLLKILTNILGVPWKFENMIFFGRIRKKIIFSLFCGLKI